MKISCLPFLTIFLSARLGALASTNLNVTVVGAANGTSRFEYWELTAPFDTSAQTGIVGTGTTSLGNVANITYNVIPAGFDSGLHNAPYNQWVIVLQGVAIVTLPDSNVSVVTEPGEMGLTFFADTSDLSQKGHGSYYPGVTETIFLQVPTENNELPDHQVLFDDAPCTGPEYAVLRGWATSS